MAKRLTAKQRAAMEAEYKRVCEEVRQSEIAIAAITDRTLYRNARMMMQPRIDFRNMLARELGV